MKISFCKQCNEEFIKKDITQCFCSEECKNNHTKKRNENKKDYTHVCNLCGKTFKNKEMYRKYCSKDCLKNARKKRKIRKAIILLYVLNVIG